MKELFISQIVIPMLYVVVSIIFGIIAYFDKKFYSTHKDFLDFQRQWLIQKIGIDKYNQDVETVQRAVYSAEQLGKEFDWQGALKHSKALEMIEGKTGLTDDEIFNIIKGTVGYINANKNKTVTNITTGVADSAQKPTDSTQAVQNAATNVETPSTVQSTPGASSN
jgi:hypothetical protein